VADILLLLDKRQFETITGISSYMSKVVCQSVGASQLSARLLVPVTTVREGLTNHTGDGRDRSN